MKDSFSRNITYLRVSVTDMCNLRCRYCMPDDKEHNCSCHRNLSAEAIERAIRAAASLGIRKIRITGGEPLVRNDIVEICENAAHTEGIEEVCMTTNGILLPKVAKDLKKAGVKRLNISLDTLDAKKYAYITKYGELKDALEGIEAALAAGFEKIKLNAVLIGGFNDGEIEDLASLTYRWPVDVRFIEMMPMYDSGDFSKDSFIPGTRVLEVLPHLKKLSQDDTVARLYTLPGAKGNIGLISPLSHHFCSECNRIRLTSDGMIKPCLHSDSEFPIKGLSQEEMVQVFKQAIESKPEKHKELSYTERTGSHRTMNEIGG